MTLRARLDSGGPLLGAWKQLSDPVGVELLGELGFDWIGIDTQHGLIGYEALVSMIGAAAIGGTPVIVRVPSHDAATIGRTLDAGAQGVIVPAVETVEQAARVVAACRYPPAGVRSWGPLRGSRRIDDDTPANANANAICIPMIETMRGLAEVDEIVALSGVDAVYVGPTDLALSAALPLSSVFTTGEHRDLIERIAAACQRHGVPMGTHAWGPGRAADLQAQGFRLLAVHLDIAALREGALRALDDARAGP